MRPARSRASPARFALQRGVALTPDVRIDLHLRNRGRPAAPLRHPVRVMLSSPLGVA